MNSYVLSALKECIPQYINQKSAVSVSSFEDYHYQLPLFFQVKDTASQEAVIQSILIHPAFVKAAKTGPGFLSLKLNLDYFIEKLKEPLSAYAQTVVIDYCGVNVAKQMHIGHIRSMFIGDYIANSHLAAGDSCILQNHIGDWGTQFGYLLGYLMQNSVRVEDNKHLTEIYKLAYAKYQEDADFKTFADSVSLALSTKVPGVVQLWEELVGLSMKEAQKFFGLFNLNMTAQDTRGESFYADMVEDVVEELISQGIAVKSEGAVVVFFDEKEKLSPLILQKSTGAYLYAAYDLAAIQYRVKQFNPNKIVYVVDKRQALHFQQVFAIAKKAGWANGVELQHVGFGTILGENKKPIKTREGRSLYLDELMQQGLDQYQATQHYQSLVTAGLQEYGLDKKSVIGALKYYDLHLSAAEDYVFDWKHVLNTQGNSAPYLQNAFVRIDSILQKSGANALANMPYDAKIFDLSDFKSHLQSLSFGVEGLNDAGVALVFNTMLLSDVICSQSQTYASNKLCSALIDVAKAFHSFYEATKVIGAENQEQLEIVLAYVGVNLFAGMKMLGIEPYPCVQNLKLG